jgi:hypothetical protein
VNKFESISEPWHTEKTFRCPCCRHKTLHARAVFEIRPVCFWEDDGQDDQDADRVRGGPNGELSLSAAREEFMLHGACDAQFRSNVRPPLADEF